ncbi:hypothetical protein ACH492_22145 [Streptomyces sp. NPDC019443]|uniref:hypothetical protein n=1 Tax=Streptomyces sp. NPDC019443 TaxID=3365061 RepID=UPI00378B300D
MPDFQIRVNATRTGPFRDGRFQRAASQYSDALNYAVAEHGEKLVKTRLNQVLKKQTPYYRLRITVRRNRGGYEVTDQGVIYGPWLEGTGSRNAPVTRFRGYATFRRVKPIVDRDANRIAIQLLNRYQARGLLR